MSLLVLPKAVSTNSQNLSIQAPNVEISIKLNQIYLQNFHIIHDIHFLGPSNRREKLKYILATVESKKNNMNEFHNWMEDAKHKWVQVGGFH